MPHERDVDAGYSKARLLLAVARLCHDILFDDRVRTVASVTGSKEPRARRARGALIHQHAAHVRRRIAPAWSAAECRSGALQAARAKAAAIRSSACLASRSELIFARIRAKQNGAAFSRAVIWGSL